MLHVTRRVRLFALRTMLVKSVRSSIDSNSSPTHNQHIELHRSDSVLHSVILLSQLRWMENLRNVVHLSSCSSISIIPYHLSFIECCMCAFDELHRERSAMAIFNNHWLGWCQSTLAPRCWCMVLCSTQTLHCISIRLFIFRLCILIPAGWVFMHCIDERSPKNCML